jgi:hypothetical protein
MPYYCKYCARPDIAQIFKDLKDGIPRTSVVSKYGMDPELDYGPLGKCYQDHRPHDDAFEVTAAIQRNRKMLAAELKRPVKDRMAIKDLEQRLAQLLAEQRELARLAKLENPHTSTGETVLTIEALDKLIAEGLPKSFYDQFDKIEYILKVQMTESVRNVICNEILQLLAARGFSLNTKGRVVSNTHIPAAVRETLPVRSVT